MKSKSIILVKSENPDKMNSHVSLYVESESIILVVELNKGKLCINEYDDINEYFNDLEDGPHYKHINYFNNIQLCEDCFKIFESKPLNETNWSNLTECTHCGHPQEYKNKGWENL